MACMDAHVNEHLQAPSGLVYSSPPPYKNKLLIILVKENDVNVSCEDATVITKV